MSKSQVGDTHLGRTVCHSVNSVVIYLFYWINTNIIQKAYINTIDTLENHISNGLFLWSQTITFGVNEFTIESVAEHCQ